jgi:hypothetical protein
VWFDLYARDLCRSTATGYVFTMIFTFSHCLLSQTQFLLHCLLCLVGSRKPLVGLRAGAGAGTCALSTLIPCSSLRPFSSSANLSHSQSMPPRSIAAAALQIVLFVQPQHSFAEPEASAKRASTDGVTADAEMCVLRMIHGP